MYCEWPEFRRCCLCLPLRRGILVFGYLNVVLTILQILVLFMIEGDDLDSLFLRIKSEEMPIIFAIVLCTIEIVFNIILIYGTHKKRPSFIKIFYYFMMSMVMASTILEILSASMVRGRDGAWTIYFMLCLVINLYLLFLVRSLITKLEISDGNKFSNQLADFVDGAPLRHESVYTEIVVPNKNTV